jgi:hypothetical protein
MESGQEEAGGFDGQLAEIREHQGKRRERRGTKRMGPSQRDRQRELPL